MTLLEAREVVAGYGRLPILHGVSLTLEEGEAIAVVGPNGAGKSTLMRVLAGQLPLMSGSLRYRGVELSSRAAFETARAGVGFVPQTDAVFPGLTVRENLRLGAHRLPDAEARIREMTERFPLLAERSDQPAASLSGGERQALAICSALLMQPRLLLLDEPTSGLSPKVAAMLADWIGEIAGRGMGLVWVVEQLPRQVLERVERAYVLAAGTVRFEGKASELLQEQRLEELFLQQV